MTNSKRSTEIDRQEIQWAELVAGTHLDEDLSSRWLLLRFVMAHQATAVLGLPEHPIEARVRETLAAELSRRQKHFIIPQWEEEAVLLRDLVAGIREKFPKLDQAFGDGLPSFVRAVTYIDLALTAIDDVMRKAFLEDAAKAIPVTYERLLPDNPIRITRNPDTGKVTLEDTQLVRSLRHFMQIASWQRSFIPPRPVGRPKGQAKPRKSGKEPVDPKLAERVYRAKRLNMPTRSWRQVYSLIYRKHPPSDPKAWERERGKLRHLENVGSRLYRKKSG